MSSTRDELPSVVYADIENLHRELEELAASVKPSSPDQERDASTPAGSTVFSGK